ncbi:DNA polymerase III subunit epsilon [Mucilaginibacter sp. PPCGB 2223]|uniref:exonuclease domain-containing protein n=1 Tax=Mucilaginibacter sp. PPCGB 2223 TaxID=1886027 RepID=UPI00082449E7|nr:exonuclease domain-containing protein [Mucilaginibacter sp. PPCGB 2223]OCX52630.1 DNA polymerase III subunit epsilon [Mucilaginibacter sp. PPCGB 2223]
MYAIVDIETTGSHASAHGITEIAIVIHDGTQVINRFETLVNPCAPIPVYIQALTGIDDRMVQNAPLFNDIAEQIFGLLNGNIFVAHNVNFDYSFMRHHLQRAGYDLQCPKLCTVRLGRKIFPGLPSYSLGKFCRQMGIENLSRHRAMGDAFATTQLFELMLQNDRQGHITTSLKQKSKEHSLPSNLPQAQVDALPNAPGVYYFHDQKGKIVYVGKARNLKKRVKSHFTNNRADLQKQEFLRNIHTITHQTCGTELLAFILEAVEIKRLWPKYNRAQKHYEYTYGLYRFEDQRGYTRLAIDKWTRYSQPLYTCNSMLEGYNLLNRLIAEFDLCPKLCFVQRNDQPCPRVKTKPCACQVTETTQRYNKRVNKAIDHLKAALSTFAIRDKGRTDDEYSYILIENGEFYGMGYVKQGLDGSELAVLKTQLTPYPGNGYIKSMVANYAFNNPERKVEFEVAG